MLNHRHETGSLADLRSARLPACVPLGPPPERRAIGDRLYIEKEWRGTVCFLVQDSKEHRGETALLGTGFVVGVPTPHPDIEALYIVTAGHVAAQSAPEYPIRIRANALGGGLTSRVEIQDGNWTFHKSSDVAAVAIPHEEASKIIGRGVNAIMLVDDAYFNERRIGCGQRVFMMSLFSEHAGKTSILPVARFGKISLMADPKEPVSTEWGKVEAYLVESLSWGGESGAPVFLYYTRPDGRIEQGNVLGLMQGHFDMKRRVHSKKDTWNEDEWVKVNSGMAVVIPASKIRDVLEDEALAKERIKLAEDYEARQSKAVLDSAVEPKDYKQSHKRGPVPERLKLEGDWKDAMKKTLGVERPAGGWPKRPTRKRKP